MGKSMDGRLKRLQQDRQEEKEPSQLARLNHLIIEMIQRIAELSR